MTEPSGLRPPGWSLAAPRFDVQDACDDVMVTAAMLSTRDREHQLLDALELSRILADLSERIGADVRRRATS